MNTNKLTAEKMITVRAMANEWISENFPVGRQHLSHSTPVQTKEGKYNIDLLVRYNKEATSVGTLSVNNTAIKLIKGTVAAINTKLDDHETLKAEEDGVVNIDSHTGKYHALHFGDGITETAKYKDRSIDLLLTDPPYGISSPLICEQQVPRRLRKDGRDFIMPKGHFGDWDNTFSEPAEWTATVLPKVKGWAVIFCSHAQIGEYDAILREHKFVAVGGMVWQKTNPVPFNHKFKPINAWEAIIVGKRPGTLFNGRVVHNVFKYKSPSPQQRVHPTQKPLGLMTKFVELFSPAKGVVLDPFVGGGTTVIAAAQLDRNVVGYENDSEVYRAAAKRISDAGLLK